MHAYSLLKVAGTTREVLLSTWPLPRARHGPTVYNDCLHYIMLQAHVHAHAHVHVMYSHVHVM
jgi:hypothetical protein